MTFDDLRFLIFTTRQIEGVSWYFADVTDHAQSPLCEIHGYGSDGERTVLIPNIRPDISGMIREDDLRKIAGARILCGPSKAFLDKRALKNTIPQQAKYDQALQAWNDAGREHLLADPDGYLKDLALRAGEKGKGRSGALKLEETDARQYAAS